MMDSKQKTQFYTLLNALREEVITDAQFSELEHWIISDSEAAREYVLFVKLWTDFQFFGVANAQLSDALTGLDEHADTDFWQAMANYEKHAPEIKVPQVKPKRELIQNVVYPPRERRKIGKFGIFTLMNVAAVLLLFLLLRFAAPKGGIEVATVTDSFNAKWEDAKGPVQAGTRLPINKTPVHLSEGLVKLNFDNNANVVIEGPAEFLILAEDRIGVNYGKVYVTVPKEAIGFSVYTKHAKIIDLGTEFGVAVNAFGDTSLHVMEGKTAMLVGDNSTLGSMEVGRGAAKKVLAATSTTVDIPHDSRLFVRTFDSENHLVWKGQKTINLADIVGGGNGFGTGTLDMGIDPITGKPSNERPGTRESANDYRLVPHNPCIDGVFVPNGRTQQIVSSQGHLFRDCPQTSGLSCENFMNVIRNLSSDVTEDKNALDLPAHVLLLHANMGITFDLQAIRRLLPGVNIVRFQSQFGIRKWAMRPDVSNADFWVLVDGEIRYEKQQVKIGDLYAVDIVLSENDRFLTLVQTDGGDPESRIVEGEVLSAINSDWGMFANPILVLE